MLCVCFFFFFAEIFKTLNIILEFRWIILIERRNVAAPIANIYVYIYFLIVSTNFTIINNPNAKLIVCPSCWTRMQRLNPRIDKLLYSRYILYGIYARIAWTRIRRRTRENEEEYDKYLKLTNNNAAGRLNGGTEGETSKETPPPSPPTTTTTKTKTMMMSYSHPRTQHARRIYVTS